MLLGVNPTDIQNWDFATSATPSQMLELLPGAKYENDFGTVLLALSVPTEHTDETIIAEITPFRHEGMYKDNRHPESVTGLKPLRRM